MNTLAFLIDPAFAGFLAASMRLAIPIMLAALGGLFSERSGVLNIGLEGAMLIGAFVGFVAAYLSGSLAVGVLAAIVAGIVFGLILGLYTITLGSNQVVVGIAMNLLAIGVTAFFYRLIFGSGTQSPRVDAFPPLDLGPHLGTKAHREPPVRWETLLAPASGTICAGSTAFIGPNYPVMTFAA